MFNTPIVLNQYQQLLVRLSLLAPYNAVHSVLIPEGIELEALHHSLQAMMQHLGMGHPQFSKDYQSVSFLPMQEQVGIERYFISLQEHAEQEMNYFFAANECPLRFCIIVGKKQSYFSITYNHWIADADAISHLMQSIFAYLQTQIFPQLSLNGPPIEECFKHIYKYGLLYYRCFGVAQNVSQFIRGFRTPIKTLEDMECGCHMHVFDKEILHALLVHCKQQSITLNDLFIAVLARLFGQITQSKRKNARSKWFKPKRNHIIIAVISNLRKESYISLSSTFGLFLGFFYLSFKTPEGLSLKALSASVHKRTQRLKRRHIAVKQYLLCKVQSYFWDRAKHPRSQFRLFSKNTPITVGISNMNLSGRTEHMSSYVSQYIRFSPTAMVCPIVFNITTFNHCMALGINFRKACYTVDEINSIKQAFVNQLEAVSHSIIL